MTPSGRINAAARSSRPVELPIRYRVMAQLAHDDDQTTDSSKWGRPIVNGWTWVLSR